MTESIAIDKRIDLSLALKYRFQNKLTYQEIADKFNVSRQAVEQRINGFMAYLGDSEENNAYDTNRSYFLTGIERQLIFELLDKDRLKKATTGNIAYAVDKVYQMLRQERGQSTGTQAVQINVISFSQQNNESKE